VEVKGGEAVRCRSLKNYLKTWKPRLALRFSERNFHEDGPLGSVPLYFLPRIGEVIQ